MTFQLTSFTMRFLSYLMMLLLAATLTACGGGGGSAGVTLGTPIAALTTTAPSNLTIGIGSEQTFTISGGKSPYKVSSSDVRVSSPGTKDSQLTIGGVSPGTATVTVIDADAKRVDIAVTVPVPSVAPFTTTAPAALTLAQSTTRIFDLSGGLGNYSVQSADNRFVTAAVSGTKLNINAVAVTSAAIPVLVRDQAGTVLTIAVTVGNSLTVDVFTTAPPTVSLAPATSATFTILGGVGPYAVVSDDTRVATASIAGANLIINSQANGMSGAANVTVRDSTGKTAPVIKVSVLVQDLFITPNKAKAFINDVLIATITGGTPPYRASVGISGTVSATIQNQNQLVIKLLQTATAAVVTVLDANDKSIAYTADISAGTDIIRLSPNAITISENSKLGSQPILLTIFGAAPGTIDAFTSDLTLLKASVTGTTVTLSVGSLGNICVGADKTVQITIVDSGRALGLATVTIADNNGGPGC